jgi:hypothetical protein
LLIASRNPEKYVIVGQSIGDKQRSKGGGFFARIPVEKIGQFSPYLTQLGLILPGQLGQLLPQELRQF